MIALQDDTAPRAEPGPRRALFVLRWTAFALALAAGALLPFLIQERIHTLVTSKGLQTQEEVELAAMAAQWFAALANIISLCFLSLLLAGILKLVTARLSTQGRLTTGLIAQTGLCLILTVIFILEVWQ